MRNGRPAISVSQSAELGSRTHHAAPSSTLGAAGVSSVACRARNRSGDKSQTNLSPVSRVQSSAALLQMALKVQTSR